MIANIDLLIYLLIDPVDESLCHLFYMFKKLSKKV